MSQPLFGLVPAGQPLITEPTSAPTPTSLLFSIPPAAAATATASSHITVFLLPGAALPPGTAAAIYLVTPGADPSGTPASRFLGGIGPGKESAVFKISSSSSRTSPNSPGGQSSVVIGIGIEDAGSVAQRVEEAAASRGITGGGGGGGAQQPSTQVLAQRIIKNAFNFLSSFSGQAGQVEVVPLKAFEDWWRKFESRVRTDPGFLERDD
ncbi:uncharacterized protein E0L32_004887 [Thyridium curvatum]|uniref:Uncharacterized protein n=1 Tax=Thyridium curvatum TaxID=1093900 RepID=A0A507B5L9_9PEZI|nr:uncharacterized protein E0L32_004887 [Thyridium curvatum]TPX15057.1 hypothetical protein E0L32_004887 [Thyridium curvatum]